MPHHQFLLQSLNLFWITGVTIAILQHLISAQCIGIFTFQINITLWKPLCIIITFCPEVFFNRKWSNLSAVSPKEFWGLWGFLLPPAGIHDWLSLLCLPSTLKSLIWKIQPTHFLNSFHHYQLPQATKKANCSCSSITQQDKDMSYPNTNNRAQHSGWQLGTLGICYTGSQSRPPIPSPFYVFLLASGLLPHSSLPFSLSLPLSCVSNLCYFTSIFCWIFYIISGWSMVKPEFRLCGRAEVIFRFRIPDQVSGV